MEKDGCYVCLPEHVFLALRVLGGGLAGLVDQSNGGIVGAAQSGSFFFFFSLID